MNTPSILITLALTSGLACADDAGREIRLADCPPAVRAMIDANDRDGRLDEIERIAIGDRELYIAEVELAGDLDLTIHVRGDGTLVKTREDLPSDAYPAFAQGLANDRGGRLDDIDKETADGKTTYLVEIDRREQPDLDLVTDESGKVLSETENHDD